MEFTTLLKLKHRDVGALIMFCLIGLLVGSAIHDPTWAAYTGFLVFDHLALGWLVFMDENSVKRAVPIEFIIAVHMAFVVLVVVVVAARDSLPYFGLFPYPMAAMALWLLSSAIGFEKSDEDRSLQRRIDLANRTPRLRESKKPVRTRFGARSPRVATAPRESQPEPAIKEWRPAEWSGQADAEPARHSQQTRPANGSRQRSKARRAAEPEPAIKEWQPAPGSLQPQPNQRSEQTHPANGSPQTAAAGLAAQREPATVSYQPMVSGVPLALEIPMNPSSPAPEPELSRDNSIAEGLRQSPSEAIIRHNPILAATAEDNEEWLRLRRLRNPTHRKLGVSVRDEYEQWLRARIRARIAAGETAQSTQEGAS
jgi:hypothetical protein